MGRNRTHASNAERQRSYRLRAAAKVTGASPSELPSRRRNPSRPARLSSLCGAAEALKGEYEAWLDNLPDSLQDSDQAARLAETIEQLGAVVELLEDIQPPRGFGRD